MTIIYCGCGYVRITTTDIDKFYETRSSVVRKTIPICIIPDINTEEEILLKLLQGLEGYKEKSKNPYISEENWAKPHKFNEKPKIFAQKQPVLTKKVPERIPKIKRNNRVPWRKRRF